MALAFLQKITRPEFLDSCLTFRVVLLKVCLSKATKQKNHIKKKKNIFAGVCLGFF